MHWTYYIMELICFKMWENTDEYFMIFMEMYSDGLYYS